MQIYRARLRLWEHTYFASREIGILYETEPLVGNYALAYALGLARAPYNWGEGPRYRQDLTPLNEAGVYVTPATFEPETLRFTLSQFNAQSDSYFSAFANNAIVAPPTGWVAVRSGQRWVLLNPETGERRMVAASNFPQQGRIRMLGLGSTATFYLLADEQKGALQLLDRLGLRLTGRMYVRLGKFNSKAQIDWTRVGAEQVAAQEVELAYMLNPADLPGDVRLVPLSVYYVHPTPLLAHCLMTGTFWRLGDGAGTMLPAGMRFGVDRL